MTMREETARALRHMEQNISSLISAYSKTIITVSETHRWDYAIPENYTNYQDGFLWCDGLYRGMPLLNYKGLLLYLFRVIEFPYLEENEVEKYLLFDRSGNKYTFIVIREEYDGMNPSYAAFLPRVKEYTPSLKSIISERMNRTENA